MRPILGLLFLLAAPLFAQPAKETPFPTEYRRTTCATPAQVCKSFRQSQFAEIAALRGADIGQEWVDAHWAELTTALQPACERLAACFAAPGNDHLFCDDVAKEEAFQLCSRYPDGSVDRRKCDIFMTVWAAGVDQNNGAVWPAVQECGKAQQPATAVQRTLKYWFEPAMFETDKAASLRVYALDSETNVPVQAKLHIDSKDPIYAEDSPDGQPTTYYPVKWKPKLVRVTNAAGHRDLKAPTVRIVAPGYREESFTLPMEVPALKLEMNPPLKKLKRGRNQVTVTAKDAETGEPVEARVMGGATILGKTNTPFELELGPGKKRPEIWVTSLYERYSDTVVAPAEK